MKFILQTVFSIYFLSLLNSTAHGAIANVQYTSNTGSGTTITATLNGVAAGNFLVALSVGEGSGITVTGVSHGTAFTATTNSPSSSGVANVKTYIHYLANTSSGNKTVTTTFSGSTGISFIWFAEFSGVAKVNPFDIDAKYTGNSTQSTTPNLPCVTPTHSGCLLIAVMQTEGTVTSEGAGWQDHNLILTGNDWEYQVLGVQANTCVRWNQDNTAWHGVLASFRPEPPVINNPLMY